MTLELQAGGAQFGPGPMVVSAPSMPSYVEVPTPYSNGWTHPGATGGGSMLVPATRAPTYNPCETPRSAYDDWWCNEGRGQGVPWGAATWGGSVNGLSGLGGAVSELLGEGAVPGWKSALVGLGVVTALAFVLTAGAERALGLKRNGRRRRLRRNGAIVLTPAQAAALAPFNAAAAQGGWTLESVSCGVVVYRRAVSESAILIVDGQGKTRGFKYVSSGKARATSKSLFLAYLDGTVICSFRPNKNSRSRMRRNGATTRVVVTLEPNGRYTGHVLDAQSGETLAVTYAEESPFVAKREAEKLSVRIERERAKAERARPRGPYRTTPTGQTIRLVPRPKK